MKKVMKMAAALAAVMMVMALAACSHDGGSSLASLSAAGSGGSGGGGGGSGDDPKLVLGVTYDLTTGLPSGFPTADTEVSTSWGVPTAAPAKNDVTWTWVTAKDRKVKSNNGLQVSFGKTGAYTDKSQEIIKLTADEPIVVTVTFDFTGKTYSDDLGSNSSLTDFRGITVGDKSVVMSADLGVTKDDNTRTCKNDTAAKEVSIKANGIRITKIETAPKQ